MHLNPPILTFLVDLLDLHELSFASRADDLDQRLFICSQTLQTHRHYVFDHLDFTPILSTQSKFNKKSLIFNLPWWRLWFQRRRTGQCSSWGPGWPLPESQTAPPSGLRSYPESDMSVITKNRQGYVNTEAYNIHTDLLGSPLIWEGDFSPLVICTFGEDINYGFLIHP